MLGRSSIKITTTRTPASTANDKFLAILPLRVTDPALRYVADGVEEALAAKLGQMKGVHILDSDEVKRVNPDDPLDKIAHRLGAKQIVQGVLQGSGDKIDIVLKLSDASGRMIWTKEFPGLRQDLLTIEDQTFNQLSDALALKLSTEDLARTSLRPTENISAYEQYLKGRDIMRGKLDVETPAGSTECV